MRKIVLFFVFFLFIFLSAKQTALAVFDCTFDIKENLVKDIKTINVKIGGNSNLGTGKYQVTFYGDAILTDISGTPYSFDSSEEQFTNDTLSLQKTFANPLMTNGTGTFKIYVQNTKASRTKPSSDYLCVSPIYTVRAIDTGGTCDIIPASTNKFATSGTVSFKTTFINRDNDTRRVWVYDDATGKDFPSSKFPSFNNNDCHGLTELETGLDLGSLPTGNYSIRIGTSCNFPADDPTKACRESFQITPDGGGPPPAESTLCYSCPAGCAWDNIAATPSCKNSSSGATCEVKSGYCPSDKPVCDLNHVYGCVRADGLPTGPNDPPLNPPFCTLSSSGGDTIYTCHTAIGDIVASPQGFISSLFGLILSISGGIALLLIIISGYRILSSQGNPEALKGAREQLTAAIVGLLFIIFALVILQIIGVDILRIPGFGSGSPSAPAGPR